MSTHHRNGYLIHTYADAKPIPDRRFDWNAILDNYEPNCPCGWGRTEEEAINDLLEQLDDQNEELRCMTDMTHAR